MSQTLQAAAEADRAAEQLAEGGSGRRPQRARAAAQKSADADRAVQQAHERPRKPPTRPNGPARAAEAAEAAERASSGGPEPRGGREGGGNGGRGRAQRKAQSLGEIVGTASKADTPTAWSEALRLASAAVGLSPSASSPRHGVGVPVFRRIRSLLRHPDSRIRFLLRHPGLPHPLLSSDTRPGIGIENCRRPWAGLGPGGR